MKVNALAKEANGLSLDPENPSLLAKGVSVKASVSLFLAQAIYSSAHSPLELVSLLEKCGRRSR